MVKGRHCQSRSTTNCQKSVRGKIAHFGLKGMPRLWCKECSISEYSKLDVGAISSERDNTYDKCEFCFKNRATYVTKNTHSNTMKACGVCANMKNLAPSQITSTIHKTCRICNTRKSTCGVLGESYLWCRTCGTHQYTLLGIRGTLRTSSRRTCVWPECLSLSNFGFSTESLSDCKTHALLVCNKENRSRGEIMNSKGVFTALSGGGYSKMGVSCVDYVSAKTDINFQHAESLGLGEKKQKNTRKAT